MTVRFTTAYQWTCPECGVYGLEESQLYAESAELVHADEEHLAYLFVSD